MIELPTGTITFLLTDIEGSTALWEETPEAMRAALTRHDALLVDEIHGHRGIVVKHRGEGDSIFAVFAAASDAVAAALSIQRSLTTELWPTARPIRVRIGIHTGEAQLREGDYFGPVINRCARLRAIGQGGQTLLSEATATLVRDDLPAGTSLLDLGEHRLKGLHRPERVLQLTALDLPTGPPPLDSLGPHPNNLPIQTTTLIGREREVGRIHELLLEPHVRLLTLTGPGGTGKTRLALHAGADLLEEFVDGVYFIDLAPITDPSLIVSTIGPALGLTERGEHLLDDLKNRLHDRSLLLILDNFEQVLSGASLVADLLTASAGVKILVTSRAALQVRGEHELEVPPLALPQPDQTAQLDVLQQYGAIALFVDRARAVRSDFALSTENGPTVATICTRLDGLPLAIELAAARVRLLTPEAMVRRLEHRLPLLTGGPRDLPARQRTLRDTIAWSYDLLDETEQRVFRTLSAFVGGFTLDVAETMLADPDQPSLDVLDAVSQLVTRSLVRQIDGSGDEPRFGMLETIREFGLAELDAWGETADVRRRHLAWCLDLVGRYRRETDGSLKAAGENRIKDEHDNIRAALGWSLTDADAAELGARIAGVLGSEFWTASGYVYEGRAWLRRLLERVTTRSRGRATALEAAGYLALRQRDYPVAIAAYDEALAIFRELGDRPEIARTLRHYGILPTQLGQFDRAQAMLEESATILRELGNLSGVSMTLHNLGDLALDRGDDVRAMAAYEECLTLARQVGNRHATAYALRGLGHVERSRGQYVRAEAHLRESLTWLRPLRDIRCTPLTLEGLACITIGAGWAERAARLLGAAQAMQEKTGTPSPPSAMADYERTVADARAALGEERFATVWAAGAALSLDEAIACALSTDRAQGETAPATTNDHHLGLATDTMLASVASTKATHRKHVPLSAREVEVVSLIAQGLSNRQIAEQLVLSVRTVERHIENVYNRLGISGKAGRAIVTAYALRHQLVAVT